MPARERPVDPDNPNGYTANVNGRWVSDEEAEAWAAMLRATLEGEMAEARAYEEQMELVRPLTAEEALRGLLSAILAKAPLVAAAIPDEALGRMQPYLPRWDAGGTYARGDLVAYGEGDGATYRCLQAHRSQAGWEPDAAPSLWAKVLTAAGEALPWEQPASTNPYMRGDRVLWDGRVWESEIDNNVWMPGVYGWAETESEE